MRKISILLVLALCACAPGSGAGLDASGRPAGQAPDPSDLPTLENIQARIFTPICVQCHVGAAAPQGLRLDEANSFGDLVGVASREVPALNRVEPFDPERSYLYQKINGTAAVGGRMPLGGPNLPNEDIELVRQWIADGAQPTPTASKGNGGTVSALSLRQSGSTVIVRLTASTELDASSILPSSFRIVSSEDEIFGNADDRTVTDFSVSAASATPYVVEMRTVPPQRHLQISLANSTPTQVLDRSGRPIQPYSVNIRLESEE